MRARTFWVCQNQDERMGCIAQGKRIRETIRFIEIWNEVYNSCKRKHLGTNQFFRELQFATGWSLNRICNLAEKHRKLLLGLDKRETEQPNPLLGEK